MHKITQIWARQVRYCLFQMSLFIAEPGKRVPVKQMKKSNEEEGARRKSLPLRLKDKDRAKPLKDDVAD